MKQAGARRPARGRRGVAGIVTLLSAGGGAAGAQDDALGRELYETQCAACHATDGTGVEDRGPPLTDEGRASVDFVLRTGRMPLAAPGMQAKPGPTRYTEEQIVALVDYAGAFGDGPDIPDVDPARGDLANGRPAVPAQLRGLPRRVRVPGRRSAAAARRPTSSTSTPTEIGEAILVGPGAMPVFGSFTDQDLDDVAAYIGDLRDAAHDRPRRLRRRRPGRRGARRVAAGAAAR